MAIPDAFVRAVTSALPVDRSTTEPDVLARYAVDALGQGRAPDLVVLPSATGEVACVARLCTEHRVPLVVRGAGTGYTGGAVPTQGGVVLSMERLGRIVEIDQENLLAVVEPNVVTGDLQRAVEQVGLFYPPDPASLETSSIGGNIAECAGGPRAFKYGTTRRYVLALEAVLPTGQIVRTGSKAVKNVVGYDLTQLLVGSEGTLAIITQATLRLIPRPHTRAALSASFATVQRAVDAVTALLDRRVVPAAIEFVDEPSLRAIEAHLGRAVTPAGSRALLIVECDGSTAGTAEDLQEVLAACTAAGALATTVAAGDREREELWHARRQLSPALRATGLRKVNHDVSVPRGRVPALIEAVEALGRRHQLLVACFGHAGDGNLHVNFMIPPDDHAALDRVRTAERELFERVVELEGSISGEHGIGFSKAPYLGLELSTEVIALMRRVKDAFDPAGILNPGKIFP